MTPIELATKTLDERAAHAKKTANFIEHHWDNAAKYEREEALVRAHAGAKAFEDAKLAIAKLLDACKEAMNAMDKVWGDDAALQPIWKCQRAIDMAEGRAT